MTFSTCVSTFLGSNKIGYCAGFVLLATLLIVDQSIKTFDDRTPRTVSKQHDQWHKSLTLIFTALWWISLVPFPRTEVFDTFQTKKLKKKLGADNLAELE